MTLVAVRAPALVEPNTCSLFIEASSFDGDDEEPLDVATVVRDRLRNRYVADLIPIHPNQLVVDIVNGATRTFLETRLAEELAQRNIARLNELPVAIWERIAPRFGLPVDERAAAAMRAAARRTAKDPARVFSSDRETKLFETTDEMRAATARWAQEPYERLELARSGRGPRSVPAVVPRARSDG
jgi:hypothetical protein